MQGPAPFEQTAMPSPPGALAGLADRPVGSIPLGKGRIEGPDPASEAGSLLRQGRYEDAERAYRNLLSELEGRQDPNLRDVAQTLANLAVLFHIQARFEEATRFYRASIEVTNRQWEKAGTPERSQYENRLKLSQLANVLHAQGFLDEAQAMHERVLSILEDEFRKAQARKDAGQDQRSCYRLLEAELDIGLGANNVAQLYFAKGDYARSQAFYKKALDIFIRVRGTADHTDPALALNNLALVAQAKGDDREAESLLLKSYQSFRAAHSGDDHPDLVVVLRNLAALYSHQRLAEKALQSYSQAVQIVAARMQRRTGPGHSSPLTAARNEIDWNRSLFDGLVAAAMQVREVRPAEEASLSERAFEAAQLSSQAQAGAAMLQMAARQSHRDPELARIIRDRQDLIEEAEKQERALISSISGAPETRDATLEKALRDRLDAIDRDVIAIDTRLGAEFPEYFVLVEARPVSLQHIQKLLQEDEALVSYHLTSGEGFAWAITRDTVKWVKLDASGDAIARQVMTLRCGLDAQAWTTRRCAELTGQRYRARDQNADRPPPFSHAHAFSLYRTLFGQIEEVVEGKRLLVVPSGALTQLPFHVLVTREAPDADHRSANWLIRRHALAVLPAVSSLKALRGVAHSSTATRPMIGFGNPLLDGDQEQPPLAAYFKTLAQLARNKQSCTDTGPQRMANQIAGGVAQVETRGGFADTAFLRQQVPLPETADELCAVAGDIGANASEMRLGTRATEREVKAMSTRGELAQYRVVHFATHGALAGELKGSMEPGLILTPPDTASEEDDGYLSASEIAALRLDADWVILSACNTAAGDAASAEALSGLARAFIYAQARALLVSHWAVSSNATVKLITAAMREIASDKTVGRAEALRRAMLALIDKGEAQEAHPAYWAPFIVVGEGAL